MMRLLFRCYVQRDAGLPSPSSSVPDLDFGKSKSRIEEQGLWRSQMNSNN